MHGVSSLLRFYQTPSPYNLKAELDSPVNILSSALTKVKTKFAMMQASRTLGLPLIIFKNMELQLLTVSKIRFSGSQEKPVPDNVMKAIHSNMYSRAYSRNTLQLTKL